MLPENKLKEFGEFVAQLSREELIWVNGYLNGIISNNPKASTQLIDKPVTTPSRITVTYGTETGNSKKLATEFANRAKSKGIQSKLISLDQYRLNDLQKEEYFFTIVSTHGDGEPPEAAKKFYDHIHNNGFKVSNLKYGVLALGDTSYPLFCKTGEEIDEQLAKLGGNRLAPLQKCDLEFDEQARNWFDQVIQELTTQQPEVKETIKPKTVTVSKTSRQQYKAEVLSNILLNDQGSKGRTHHIELAVDEVEYEPGDSIGYVPSNFLSEVNAIIKFTGVDSNESVIYKDETFTVENLLLRKVSILNLLPSVVKKYAALTGYEIEPVKTDLITLLEKYPLTDKTKFTDVLQILNPIAPRLYTIASSPQAHPGELHLTVELDEYFISDEIKYGLGSRNLIDLKEGDNINFFIQKNKRFRLPADDAAVMMISPGTGIAASRSFFAEREARGATGKNWLFFGERNFVTDFLYQTEIQNWFETGLLEYVNVAFHEDRSNLHVEDKVVEFGERFYDWLQAGAYVYVCGEKDPMSKNVKAAVLKIIETHGHKTTAEAVEYLSQLETTGRYNEDVY